MTSIKHTLALLTCSLAGAVANAATVQITFDNSIFNGSGSDDVHIQYAAPNSGTATNYVAAGRFQGTASDIKGVNASIFYSGVNDVFMYCYDVYQEINSGWSVNYTINLNAAAARTLDFLGAVNTVLGKGKTYDPYAWLHDVTADQGAAIQLGIWESIYDSQGWDLNGGTFKAWDFTGGTASWWKKFQDVINSTNSLDGKYVMVLTNDTYQDMIAGDPPTNDVPEPGSVALIGAALAGLTLVRRKKSQ